MGNNTTFKLSPLGPIPSDWEVKELGEIAEFLDGKRKPIKDEDRSKIQGIYPYYGASGIIDYVNDYIFDDELILLGEDGANIINRSSPLAFKVSGKIWINNHAHVLKPINGYEIGFVTEFLESIKYDKYNTGTAQPKLNKEICSGIPVLCPPLPEQRAIAACLSIWDNAITKVQALLAQKELRKKWLMQQLLTGKKRLKGFDEEWKEIKLGDYIEICSSKRVLEEDWKPSGVPFYRTREIICLSNNEEFRSPIFITENLFAELMKKNGVPKAGDILVTGVGTIGETYIVKPHDKFYFKDGNVLWFKMNKSINSSYLQHQFKTHFIRKQLSDNASITTVATYTIEGAKSTKVMLPSIHEQTAIAHVLQAADKEIQLLKAKVDRLKEEKKGLMQVLLTGKKRLNINIEIYENNK